MTADERRTLARDLVVAYMADAWGDYEYTSVDDVLGI